MERSMAAGGGDRCGGGVFSPCRTPANASWKRDGRECARSALAQIRGNVAPRPVRTNRLPLRRELNHELTASESFSTH